MTADRAGDPMAEVGGRRRPRDRGFQRPPGPALVARPEPLAGAPAAPPTAAPPWEPDTTTATTPVEEEPDATPQSTADAASAQTVAKEGRGSGLPMPPSRHVELRVQFNTKLRPVTVIRTKAFADHHQASIQDVVELALDEYLTRRGWPTDPDS